MRSLRCATSLIASRVRDVFRVLAIFRRRRPPTATKEPECVRRASEILAEAEGRSERTAMSYAARNREFAALSKNLRGLCVEVAARRIANEAG